MSPNKRTPAEFPDQTIASAAELTGLSTVTIRRYIASGELPAWRIGRRIRIAKSDLLALYTPVTDLGADDE